MTLLFHIPDTPATSDASYSGCFVRAESLCEKMVRLVLFSFLSLCLSGAEMRWINIDAPFDLQHWTTAWFYSLVSVHQSNIDTIIRSTGLRSGADFERRLVHPPHIPVDCVQPFREMFFNKSGCHLPRRCGTAYWTPTRHEWLGLVVEGVCHSKFPINRDCLPNSCHAYDRDIKLWNVTQSQICVEFTVARPGLAGPSFMLCALPDFSSLLATQPAPSSGLRTFYHRACVEEAEKNDDSINDKVNPYVVSKNGNEICTIGWDLDNQTCKFRADALNIWRNRNLPIKFSVFVSDQHTGALSDCYSNARCRPLVSDWYTMLSIKEEVPGGPAEWCRSDTVNAPTGWCPHYLYVTTEKYPLLPVWRSNNWVAVELPVCGCTRYVEWSARESFVRETDDCRPLTYAFVNPTTSWAHAVFEDLLITLMHWLESVWHFVVERLLNLLELDETIAEWLWTETVHLLVEILDPIVPLIPTVLTFLCLQFRFPSVQPYVILALAVVANWLANSYFNRYESWLR